MNPFAPAPWPVTLAQADDAAPLDTSPPPASTADPQTATGEPGTPGEVGPDGAPTTAPAPNPLGGLLFPMVLIIGLLLIFSLGGGRREKKRRAEIMAKLAKGAKVQTVGGVLGTVVEVRDDEVLVKVDENSNTRMRFAKSAITAVTAEE
ncbi:MAG: preprotein translocase subunit YajC [Planctomycetota bacterium]